MGLGPREVGSGVIELGLLLNLSVSIALNVPLGLGNSEVLEGVDFVGELLENVSVLLESSVEGSLKVVKTLEEEVLEVDKRIAGLGDGGYVEVISLGELGEDFSDGDDVETLVSDLVELVDRLEVLAHILESVSFALEERAEGLSVETCGLIEGFESEIKDREGLAVVVRIALKVSLKVFEELLLEILLLSSVFESGFLTVQVVFELLAERNKRFQIFGVGLNFLAVSLNKTAESLDLVFVSDTVVLEVLRLSLLLSQNARLKVVNRREQRTKVRSYFLVKFQHLENCLAEVRLLQFFHHALLFDFLLVVVVDTQRQTNHHQY